MNSTWYIYEVVNTCMLCQLVSDIFIICPQEKTNAPGKVIITSYHYLNSYYNILS